MSHSDIRVVPGPANYYSHPGSLARLQDFYSEEQLSRAVWVYGERAIAGAQAFLPAAFNAPGAKKILFKGHCSESDVSELVRASGDDRSVVIGVGGGALLDTAKALAAGADVVHFDVMDNHYVPNLTIGPMVLKSLRNYGITAPIDVHLMVKPVDRIIPDFAEAGASIITFHPEASEHVDRSLQLIKEHGCKAGLVFNPATPLSYLDYVMDKLDVILLMSVNPGFGGQSFIPQTLDKLREVRQRIDASGYDIRLEVDGGVKASNIGEIAAAGADMFVAGSAIFGQPDYKQVIDQMRSELAKVSHG